MISELFRKWFGLSPPVCVTCEILRDQLDKSELERRELLHRLIDKDKSEPPPNVQPEFKPIQPQFIPWRVRQQMLEAEDKQKARLTKEKAKEIEELEKEMGVSTTSEDHHAREIS